MPKSFLKLHYLLQVAKTVTSNDAHEKDVIWFRKELANWWNSIIRFK